MGVRAALATDGRIGLTENSITVVNSVEGSKSHGSLRLAQSRALHSESEMNTLPRYGGHGQFAAVTMSVPLSQDFVSRTLATYSESMVTADPLFLALAQMFCFRASIPFLCHSLIEHGCQPPLRRRLFPCL